MRMIRKASPSTRLGAWDWGVGLRVRVRCLGIAQGMALSCGGWGLQHLFDWLLCGRYLGIGDYLEFGSLSPVTLRPEFPCYGSCTANPQP